MEPGERESAYELFQRGSRMLAEHHFGASAVLLERALALEPGKASILEALGQRIGATAREVAPDAELLAGPELGAVALAAAASLASRLPFLIVRKEQKGYGTGNRLEGVWGQGERVCLVEDVVTSGGAAVEAVNALREAGLECRTAVCVVDREEGRDLLDLPRAPMAAKPGTS